MLHQYIILDKEGETTIVESLNKVTAMEDAKSAGIESPLYPSPYESPAQISALALQFVKKLCTLYGADNDTLYRIAVDTRRANGLISSFVPDENTTFEEYVARKLSDLSPDSSDLVSEATLSIVESLANGEDFTKVKANAYARINHYIYGEKRTFNESGSYTNVIQNADGEIIPDTTNRMEALTSVANGNGGRIARIIRKAITADGKFTEDDCRVIAYRVSGLTYEEVIAKVDSFRSVSAVKAVMERLQRAVRKIAAKESPEILSTLYKVTSVKVTDGDGEVDKYRRLEKI